MTESGPIWNGDYYYMVGWNHEQEETRTYRVDRILRQPDILEKEAWPVPEDFDVARYTCEVLRMYDNEEPEEESACLMSSLLPFIISL